MTLETRSLHILQNHQYSRDSQTICFFSPYCTKRPYLAPDGTNTKRNSRHLQERPLAKYTNVGPHNYMEALTVHMGTLYIQTLGVIFILT